MYYYVLEDYQVSNSMLSEDVYVCGIYVVLPVVFSQYIQGQAFHAITWSSSRSLTIELDVLIFLLGGTNILVCV